MGEGLSLLSCGNSVPKEFSPQKVGFSYVREIFFPKGFLWSMLNYIVSNNKFLGASDMSPVILHDWPVTSRTLTN